MLRAATRIYGRVLLRSGVAGVHSTRAVTVTLWTNTPRFQMQRRTRSSTTAPSDASAIALVEVPILKLPSKRSHEAAAAVDSKAIHIKEEVQEWESESASMTVATRRSTRVKIKRDVAVKIKAEASLEVDDAGPDDEDKDSHTQTAKKKKQRLRVVKRDADGTPEHWEDVLLGIQKMRASQIADVDVAGVETMFDDGAFAPHIARFHVLISAMLSSQTKDPVNAAAMKRLISHGLTVADMLIIDEKVLAKLIYPVGFYNNKARYIKQVAQILTDHAAETGSEVVDIPDEFAALVALPGVGPKMAHLVMSCAWDNTVGICVDTHVHRISNRLGWVSTWNKKNPKSQDPEKTRRELEDWLPREHWHPINVTLVGFGQTVCLPRGPKCSECTISHLCPSAFSSVI